MRLPASETESVPPSAHADVRHGSSVPTAERFSPAENRIRENGGAIAADIDAGLEAEEARRARAASRRDAIATASPTAH
jgi:hypothetical protein